MIEKRINYRFGGGYQGSSAGPAGGASSGGNYGGNTGNNQSGSGEDDARERAIAQQYSAPAPAPAPREERVSPPREERVSPIESIARIGDTSLAGKTREEADRTMESQNEVEKDAREEYISEMYTKPPVTPTEDKVPDFVKQVVTPTEEPKIDVGFQEALRKQQIATDLRQKQQDPNYGQFFRPTPVVEKPRSNLGNIAKNVAFGIVAPQLLAGTPFYKPYSMYKTANRLSNVADKLGWRKPKDVMQTLTSNITTPGKTRLKNIDIASREGGDIIKAQAPKNVIEKNIQKFSPEHLNILHKRYAELQEVIKSGEYMGQKLNNNQLATLTQTSKQMKDFLVSEVGGIRLT